MRIRFGRYVFGLGAVAFGLITLTWHRVNALGGLSHSGILVYTAGIAELAGGIAVLWQKTVRLGAIILVFIFSIFSLYWIPLIIRTPLDFPPYGNFFEIFSILIGSVFILASTLSDHQDKTAVIEKAAYICYGVCVVTYALYQLLYLKYTASLVPKWIPPGQMFWAVATTIAFALAAIAILSGRSALLASRLLTIMLVAFGLLIWVPACVIHPHVTSNWTENCSNLAMAGSAWIVVDYLTRKQSAGATV